MRYSLRQLEVFLATAHEENITKAANHLAMSQSAASSALSELESQFDMQLFDRVGKKLQLNAFGRGVRPRAEALMQQAKEFETTLDQQRGAGDLKVGATLTIGNYLAVGIMARYMGEYPENRVALEVANTATIAQKVLNFELDIGLIEGEWQHPDMEVIPWCDDELVMFCSSTHPYAKKKTIATKDLLKAEWILREAGSGTRQTFDRAMHGLLSDIHVTLELQHTEAIKRAVEADLGIGCLSQMALEDAFQRGSLVKLTTPKRSFKRRFYFVLHKQKYQSSVIERWIQLCETYTR
ncbi:MAG: LysR family transcriptional regulator [Moraxellaceae bacterium]|nr:MAG: LysR family transcriptional regulator [Moraxellaceae bacterium]